MKDKPIFIECNCCGQYHPVDFIGDCIDSNNRFTYWELPYGCEIITLEEQEKWDAL